MAPPDQTGAESAQYAKQAHLGTRLVICLESGEELEGALEWHDRDCLKLRLDDGTGLVVMKHAIVHTSPKERSGTRSNRRPRRA